jgi:hypothetical protein
MIALYFVWIAMFAELRFGLLILVIFILLFRLFWNLG